MLVAFDPEQGIAAVIRVNMRLKRRSRAAPVQLRVILYFVEQGRTRLKAVLHAVLRTTWRSG